MSVPITWLQWFFFRYGHIVIGFLGIFSLAFLIYLWNGSDFALRLALAGAFLTASKTAHELIVYRTTFLREYVSGFFTDQEQYETYQELIYGYPDEIFEKAIEIYKKVTTDSSGQRRSLTPSEKLKDNFLDGLNQNYGRDKEEHLRFFHPLLFQGSLEESRIDRLLGSLNVLGYYYELGLVDDKHLKGLLGDHLRTIGKRAVMKCYFQAIKASPEYSHLSESEKPLAYLKNMLVKLGYKEKDGIEEKSSR